MPKFDVEIPHTLSVPDARARLDRAKAKLEQDYGATCTWEGEECLLVKRKGLDARVQVQPEKVLVHCELGLLMAPMAGAIRSGITKQLTELFTSPS